MIWRWILSSAKALSAPARRSLRGIAEFIGIWVVIWSLLWVVWAVLQEARPLLRPDEPTLVYLDLLQAMAFLVAWSALLITIAAKLVSAKGTLDLKNARSEWAMKLAMERIDDEKKAIEDQRRRFSEHLREHPDIEGQLARAEARSEGLMAKVESAQAEVYEAKAELAQLAGENKRLRTALTRAGIPYEPGLGANN